MSTETAPIEVTGDLAYDLTAAFINAKQANPSWCVEYWPGIKQPSHFALAGIAEGIGVRAAWSADLIKRRLMAGDTLQQVAHAVAERWAGDCVRFTPGDRVRVRSVLQAIRRNVGSRQIGNKPTLDTTKALRIAVAATEMQYDDLNVREHDWLQAEYDIAFGLVPR